jgi:hypothetical protein
LDDISGVPHQLNFFCIVFQVFIHDEAQREQHENDAEKKNFYVKSLHDGVFMPQYVENYL